MNSWKHNTSFFFDATSSHIWRVRIMCSLGGSDLSKTPVTDSIKTTKHALQISHSEIQKSTLLHNAGLLLTE